MLQQDSKKVDFSGTKITVGLDVHKKNWSVTILVDGMEHKTFHQPAEPRVLVDYLHRMFPGGEYRSAYEAGFCGYSIHRELVRSGIDNRVINPSDIPRNQKEMLDINRQLRRYIKRYDGQLYELLRTIPGIGPLTAITLITELGDIERFRNLNQLSSYVGLMPRVNQSGEHERVGDLTFRCNRYLRTMIVEATWQAIRMDPVLMQYYKQKIVNSKGQKVIIKVARKLVNRIRYVMKNRRPYELGVME
jgi:transposase